MASLSLTHWLLKSNIFIIIVAWLLLAFHSLIMNVILPAHKGLHIDTRVIILIVSMCAQR